MLPDSKWDVYKLVLSIVAILVLLVSLVQLGNSGYIYDLDGEVKTFRGILEHAVFPVHSGPPMPLGISPFRAQDVLCIQGVNDLGDPEVYFLHYGGRTEMVLLGSRGFRVADTTSNVINEYLELGVPVEILGVPFRVDRGKMYHVINIHSIRVFGGSNSSASDNVHIYSAKSQDEYPLALNLEWYENEIVKLDLVKGEKV